MMRSAELRHCLESRHLWFDSAANALISKDLETAEKLLKEAPGKKDPIEQMSGSYQAMYCATVALLHSIRYKASGFRCLVTVLEEYFVKNGKLDRVQVDQLIRAQKLEATPKDSFAIAESYIVAIKKVLT